MRAFAVVVAITLTLAPLAVAEEKRIPLLIDTNFGTQLDDAFALALAIASPEVELRGITTSGGDAETRAWMVCRLLTSVDRGDVPVAWGRPPQAEGKVEAMYQYRYHPAVLYGRMAKPVDDDACELMYKQLKDKPGEITILALGPLTNVARLLEKHPDARPWIKQIVVMGGDFSGKDRGPEPNIKSDIPAARKVLAADVPLRLIPRDAMAMDYVGNKADLTREACDKLFAAQTMLTQQLQLLDQLGNGSLSMHDVLAASVCLDTGWFWWSGLEVIIDDAGGTRHGFGKTRVWIGGSSSAEDLLDSATKRIASWGEAVGQREPRNFSELVDRGGLPRRVHVFEDYETDIEKRWWLAGKVQPAPEGEGSRHCRSVLTLDFDDKQGDHKSLYAACIFNPVPGPPMGEHTRLAFRYKLSGTDALRVQLYSLSNGYHRHLTLKGLVQDEWREATVDMTAMRRPDGSGGPLAKDERIDDIQFYVAPTASVLVDDVVLYDAAPADEKRPFPKRLVFTGWFDTGKQGQEWPGDYEIVAHEPPRTWKAAKSVENKDTGRPWIRISFRGPRPVGATTSLRFSYHLTGGKSLQLALANSRTGKQVVQDLADLPADEWTERTLEFETSDLQAADELRLIAPAGATLHIDDVLAFEAGTAK
jgi:inosine-uridine nucleoside N-ribohydrolase